MQQLSLFQEWQYLLKYYSNLEATWNSAPKDLGPRTKHDTQWAAGSSSVHMLLLLFGSLAFSGFCRSKLFFFFLDMGTLILRFLGKAQRVQSCCFHQQNVQNACQTTLIGGVLPNLMPARDNLLDEICWLGALIGQNRRSLSRIDDCWF